MEMKEDIRKVDNVCRFCRKLMKQPNYPKTLELYRDGMLCLTVDVEEASKLRLIENEKYGSTYGKYREGSLLKGATNVSRTGEGAI